MDEEFQKLWRSVAVESMDDQKIEEYLEKQVSNIHMLYDFTATGLCNDEGIFPVEHWQGIEKDEIVWPILKWHTSVCCDLR